RGEQLPRVDQVQLLVFATPFRHDHRARVWPGHQPLAHECQLDSGHVDRRRLASDAGARAAADLVTKTGTRSLLQAQQLEAPAFFPRHALERAARVTRRTPGTES